MQRIIKQDRSKAGARVHLPPPRAVIGLEAEFSLIINDHRKLPEKIFGTAQNLIRHKMLPRTGRSFQLPSGGAIYFDTGVIEVATPIVELEPGCSGSRFTSWAKNSDAGPGAINAGRGSRDSARITTFRFKARMHRRCGTRSGSVICLRTSCRRR